MDAVRPPVGTPENTPPALRGRDAAGVGHVVRVVFNDRQGGNTDAVWRHVDYLTSLRLTFWLQRTAAFVQTASRGGGGIRPRSRIQKAPDVPLTGRPPAAVAPRRPLGYGPATRLGPPVGGDVPALLFANVEGDTAPPRPPLPGPDGILAVDVRPVPLAAVGGTEADRYAPRPPACPHLAVRGGRAWRHRPCLLYGYAFPKLYSTRIVITKDTAATLVVAGRTTRRGRGIGTTGLGQTPMPATRRGMDADRPIVPSDRPPCAIRLLVCPDILVLPAVRRLEPPTYRLFAVRREIADAEVRHKRICVLAWRPFQDVVDRRHGTPNLVTLFPPVQIADTAAARDGVAIPGRRPRPPGLHVVLHRGLPYPDPSPPHTGPLAPTPGRRRPFQEDEKDGVILSPPLATKRPRNGPRQGRARP